MSNRSSQGVRVLHSNTLRGGLGGGAAQEVPRFANLDCIVRPPAGTVLSQAFEPKHVKRRHALLSALVTSNPDPLVPVFVRHRGQGNVHVRVFNNEPLVSLIHHHLFTQGTAALARFEKFLKAVGVESVAARQELDGVSTGVEGVQANCTVVAGGVQSTPVRLKGRRFHANSALVAVRMVLGPADPTNSALIAVELPLLFVIEEDTDRAPVGAKDRTIAAAIGAIAVVADRVRLLPQVAPHTLDGLDRMPVHRMRLLNVFFPLIVLVVVAKPAADVVPAARGQEGGLPPIMGAAIVRWVGHYSR